MLYVIAWICGVVNGMILKRFFRTRYPKVADKIFPSLTGNSISTGLARLRYLAGREYRTIDDPQFVSRVDKHRTIEIVSLSVVGLGLLVGAVVMTLKQ